MLYLSSPTLSLACRNKNGVMLQVELTPWHGLDMVEEEEVRVGFWMVLNWAFDQREIRKMDCSQGAY